MDKVFIEGLEIEALIGIYDWERRIRQPLRFDLEMDFDNRKPAASDDIADTLDYKAVSKRLIAFVSQSDFGLVETLAERCAELVLREFGVPRLRLKLAKPGAVRGAACVGVVIERQRADLPTAPAHDPERVRGRAAQGMRRLMPGACGSHAVTLPGSRTGRDGRRRRARGALPPPRARPVAGPPRRVMPRGGSLRDGAHVRTFITLGSNVDPETTCARPWRHCARVSAR